MVERFKYVYSPSIYKNHLRRLGIMSKRAILGGILFPILALLLGSCQKVEKGLPNVAENRKLAEHSKEFEKRILR